MLPVEVAPNVTPVLRSDPSRIRQILFNLLGNALKFTGKGSVSLGITQRFEAVSAVKQMAYDLGLMDIMMPEMDGMRDPDYPRPAGRGPGGFRSLP